MRVHRRPDGLTAEQARVLERYHAMFRRAGAGLDAAAKQRLKEIAERLASLGTTFGQNVLADEQSYVMPLARGRPRRACRISPARRRAARPTSAASRASTP